MAAAGLRNISVSSASAQHALASRPGSVSLPRTGPGEVSAVADARAGQGLGGVVAERLGDLDKRLDHAGAATAQGRADSRELEGRPGMQHEPEQPVGRRPDGPRVSFRTVCRRHDKRRAACR